MLLVLVMLTVVTRRRRGRCLDEPVVELASLVGRQAHRLVSGRELDPLALHLGFVAHDHHEVGPLLGRPEYATGRRRPLSVALSQPSFGRRFLVVSVDVRQYHFDDDGRSSSGVRAKTRAKNLGSKVNRNILPSTATR